jgi:SWI/SNF-related matrix-associated actin-dependent regulator of chromatin subfamily A-like protein 1
MSTGTRITLEGLFAWGEPKKIAGRGTRAAKTLREADLPTGFWKTYNANQAAFLQAFRVAGVVIDPKRNIAQAWADDHAADNEEEEAYQASWASACSSSYPLPKGIKAYPFQDAGVEWALKKKRGIIGDEQGLGKTIQVIMIANAKEEAIRNVLIVCPPSLRVNWRKEITKFSTCRPEITTITGRPKKGPEGKAQIKKLKRRIARDPDGQQWFIVGYPALEFWGKFLREHCWGLVALDEVQAIKTPTSKRCIATLPAYNKLTRNWDKGIHGDYQFAITGTPMGNRAAEIITILKWTRHLPGFGGDWAFKNRYCVGADGGLKGFSNKTELNRKLRTTCMIRRLKKDVLQQIPPKRRQILPLDISGGDQLIAQEGDLLANTATGATLKLLEAVDAGTDPKRYLDLVRRLRLAVAADFQQIQAMRQEMALKKLPPAIEHVLTCLSEQPDEPIILACIHHAVMDALDAALKKAGHSVVVYNGKKNDRQKNEAVEAFQEGRARVFIGQIASAGTGLTLTASHHTIFIEQDWSPGAMEQFEDRNCRIGQDFSVLIQVLVMEGSVDSYIANMLADKQEGITAVLNERLVPKAAKDIKEQPGLETVLEINALLPKTEKQIARLLESMRVLGEDKQLARTDLIYIKLLANLKTLTMQQCFTAEKLCQRLGKNLPPGFVWWLR